MDQNEILVTSIGESTLAHLGRDSIKRLSVELIPSIGEAHILLAPRTDDLQSHVRLLDKFAEVESIFMDEVSLSIRLLPVTSAAFEMTGAKDLAFTA